jgi:proline dehydrogenase
VAEHAIAEKLLYRLIKRHIAGTTMDSAIAKAKELNGKRMHVSLAFLSGDALDTTKARYATTTYLELIRSISRLGLKASVQVPLGQIGYTISSGIAEKNVNEILGTANKHGVFVWLDVRNHRFELPGFLDGAKGIGYAVDLGKAEEYMKVNKGSIRAVKALCNEVHNDRESINSAFVRLRRIATGVSSMVVQSAPDGVMRKLLNGSGAAKRTVFELQLGYKSKIANRLIRRGSSISVYVPFGKDWQQYARSTVPERYARFLAKNILNEA